ncbi:MAG: endolytic transglycosylase MltG [Oscillospiraceae bacterium]|nr:endolytic transglycosylase MltG [Oscillospiraceae bacterium]
MKKFLITLLVMLVLLGLIAGGVFLYLQYEESGNGRPDEEVTFVIEEGATSVDISGALADEGLIGNAVWYRFYLSRNEKATQLQPGTFTLNKSMSYEELTDALTQPQQYRATVRVTFPEGITAADFARRMEEAGLCTREEFLETANTGDFSQFAFWNRVETDPNCFMKAEGYLFPDTYEFFQDDDVYNMVEKIYANFEAKMTPELYARMDELGMSLNEAITLASFVQEEAGNAEDAHVSAVFHNRLAPNSPYPRLESNVSSYVQDPDDNNYIYNIMMPYYGSWEAIPQNIYDAYNTYALAGLPAGPVSNPGIDAIKAALYPDETFLGVYYFFVTDPNGKYYYGRNMAEHEANCAVAFSVEKED